MYQNSDFGSPPSSCAIAAGGCTWSERFSWASSSFARIGKRGVSGTAAENLLTMFAPKRVERETAKRTIVHDTLRLGAIDNFP